MTIPTNLDLLALLDCLESDTAVGDIDWSAEPCAELTAADLDAVEIARARNILRRHQPDSGLLSLGATSWLR